MTAALPDTQIATQLWSFLGYVLYPLWLASGAADFVCHARTDIAHTSGAGESVLHLLQTGQIGVAVLAILFFQVDASVLALAIFAAAGHTATAYWDLYYTAPLRVISPFEQFVHAFLIVLPLAGLAIIVVLHWPEAETLLAPAEADWSLRLRSPGFAPPILAAVISASVLVVVVPGLVELWSTLRRGRRPHLAEQAPFP